MEMDHGKHDKDHVRCKLLFDNDCLGFFPEVIKHEDGELRRVETNGHFGQYRRECDEIHTHRKEPS